MSRVAQSQPQPEISKWQQTYLEHFDDDLYIACTAISAGKTRILATWLVLQCCQKPGIRGIIIAQNFRALTKVLIHDILMVAEMFGIDAMWNKGSQEVHFMNGSILFGYSAENPESVLGLSEIDILAIDEAAYCNEDIYNYSRDRMRGGKYKPMVRLISSPSTMGKVQNWFSAIVKKYPDKVITATYKDNPFTSPEYKKELEERYGVGTNLFRQQCLGEIFDTDIASQLIFRSEFPTSKRDQSEETYFGFDASGLGADSDQFVVIDKFGMVDNKERKEANTFEKTSVITSLYEKYKVKFGYCDNTGGYASGALDLAKDKGLKLEGVNFAQKAFDFEKYPNARTEMYIEFAKAVKQGLWVNDQVREELLAQSVYINGRGQQQLMPKEEVKKILGHSPDICDACALAVYAMNHNDSNCAEMTPDRASAIANKYLYYFHKYSR